MVDFITAHNHLAKKTPEQTMDAIHKTSEKFIGSFFAVYLREAFQEINEEESYAMQVFGDYMADALVEKIAVSPSSRSMVEMIENSMRENAGLPLINGPKNHPYMPYINGQANQKGQHHVCKTVA